jgi:hypothetical protein
MNQPPSQEAEPLDQSAAISISKKRARNKRRREFGRRTVWGQLLRWFVIFPLALVAGLLVLGTAADRLIDVAFNPWALQHSGTVSPLGTWVQVGPADGLNVGLTDGRVVMTVERTPATTSRDNTSAVGGPIRLCDRRALAPASEGNMKAAVQERSGQTLNLQINVRLKEKSATVSGWCTVSNERMVCNTREGATHRMRRGPDGPLPGKLSFERRSGPLQDALCK